MTIWFDFNEDWLFDGERLVCLPHNAMDLPFHYFDEKAYQRTFSYEKRFTVPEAWRGQEITLHVEAAMADARVFLNGTLICRHPDGYTPFEVSLTAGLVAGENRITIVVDGTENPAIPPFGGQIDYLTYAGIYREVWIKVAAPVSVGGVKIETPSQTALTAHVSLANPRGLDVDGVIVARLVGPDGPVAQMSTPVQADTAVVCFDALAGVQLWDLETPVLYRLELELETPHGRDELVQRFGFRTLRFDTDGFRLNGRKIKLVGLNRHQSFPYVGYALGREAQRRDAEILKRDLRINIVRTSHYPQSRHFLDACDELGLLVFEEIPGWQHIGDADWKAASVDNLRAMIRRDWNHPSIVLWGVRINESQDDHEFYAQTNRVARDLDPTRPTAGVRYITHSECLEDVFAFNDFFLGQEEFNPARPRQPLRSQREVTGLDHDLPYLVTEFNGHMYPTKVFDQEQRQAEHVLRHLSVLDAAFRDPSIAGAIGWCAFDYNTHKDFGSGDRICHHGVMDMFREPKFAAHVYASQSDPDQGAVLVPVTYWSRGERNMGGVLPLIILTNCDEVCLQLPGAEPLWFRPDRDTFGHLPHPPVIIRAEDVERGGIGVWGMSWGGAEFTGFVAGQAVVSRCFAADPLPTRTEIVADALSIRAGASLRVIARVLDQAGNKLPFFMDPMSITVEGAATLLGPDIVPCRGGSVGFWLRATGPGHVRVAVETARLGVATTTIEVL